MESFLNNSQAADLLGITPGTLYNWRAYGIGPRYSKESGRVVYRKVDVLRWLRTARCSKCGQTVPHRDRKGIA